MSPKLREVFTPGGQPTLTYVSREELKLEETLERALARGFAITVVTGPTKSGKTVLCRHVLPADRLIGIEGGQVRSEADFWKQVAYHLNIASNAEKSVEKSGEGQLEFELKGRIGAPAASVDLGGKAGGKKGATASWTAGYENVLLVASLKKLKDEDRPLLVDDFHYIDPLVQKAIIQSLKGAVYEGLSVVLLAVPHRAFDPISVEDELEGRFKHVDIPDWSLSDLEEICALGFDALNVDVLSQVQKGICKESFENPLLVQEICAELCLENKVYERQDIKKKLDTSKLPEIYASIAKSKGFPKYDKLRRGSQSHKVRQPRAFKDGTDADIYSALLQAVSRLGPKPITGYDDIRGSLKEILVDNQVPAKHEVSSALSHMTKIAKTMQGEPAIEWVRENDELVITDPFLLFYMKWACAVPGREK